MKDTLFKNALAGVPRVRLVDANGKELERGYYWAIPATSYCFREDYERRGYEVIEGIVTYTTTDWGLPNEPRFLKVTPPHRLELIPEDEQ